LSAILQFVSLPTHKSAVINFPDLVWVTEPVLIGAAILPPGGVLEKEVRHLRPLGKPKTSWKYYFGLKNYCWTQ